MSRIGGLWRKRRRVIAVAAVGVAGTTSSADAAKSADTTPPSTDDASDPGGRCIVRLHGKSGAGGESYEEDGVMNVLPDGNAEGWGGRQWMYFPEEKYLEARAIVADAIESSGCDNVIINGFSNGGAFAAKLYCRGETFDGRVVRFVVDDPVPDEGVLECTPDPTVGVTLYWTGALASTATAGLELRRSRLDVRGRRDDRDRRLRRGARRRRCSRASTTSTRGTGTPRNWATGRDSSQLSRSPRRCRRRRDHVTFLTIT